MREIQRVLRKRALFCTALCAPFLVSATSEVDPIDAWLARSSDKIIQRFSSLSAGPTINDSVDPTSANLAVGESMFFDERLSDGHNISCATCHQPARMWTDGRKVAEGIVSGSRNTPTLIGVGRQEWLFWDGRAIGLAHQALEPITDDREMGGSLERMVELVATDPQYQAAYRREFGTLPDSHCGDKLCANDIERVARNMAGFLGAFVGQIDIEATRFDKFIDGLSQNRGQAMLDPAELRGLRLFMDKGLCASCHFGRDLTDGQFHNVLVPEDNGPASFAEGRYAGIRILRKSPISAYNASGTVGDLARAMVDRSQNNSTAYGAFKTPTLRGVTCTAPYMHNGRLATLESVIEHYSTFDSVVRPEHHDDPLLQPRNFSKNEKADLLAFLKTLSPIDGNCAQR